MKNWTHVARYDSARYDSVAVSWVTTTTWTMLAYTAVGKSIHFIILPVAQKCHPILMTDWLGQGVTSHLKPNRSFRRRSSQPISWLSTEKLNQTQQKQTCVHNKIWYNIKWTRKLKPGLVASYDARPRNGMGLFWTYIDKSESNQVRNK